MALLDAESVAWDMVQQDAVQCIFGSPNPTCADPLPESVLPSLLEHHGYQISTDVTTVIGRGTYGCVMKVQRVCDGRIFAMKRQTLGLASSSVDTVLREVSILNAIRGAEGLVQTANIFMAVAQISQVSTEGLQSSHGAEVWAMLEHFPGNLCETKDFFRSEWSARRVVFQLLRGLQALHEADIVHRDLKPGNVLVDIGSNPPFSTRAVICDFGLSRSISDVHSEFLEESDAICPPAPRRRRPVSTDVVTAPWRSPELWNWADVGRMSRRDLKSIDVFSLALIWAELLGGCRVIHSEDGRDPPALRLLEILRRVDCPDDSALCELGFADDVIQFVRGIASNDVEGIWRKLNKSELLHDEGYAHYLLEEQPYRGIRSWVLQHSTTLSASSPALAMIEGATRFDYRRRPSAQELLNNAYFLLLRTERREVSKCQSIPDVGDVLETEAQVQEAACERGDVDEVRASVGRVAWKFQAEIAASRSKAHDDCSSQQAVSAPLCNISCPVLLGKSNEIVSRKCGGQRHSRTSLSTATNSPPLQRCRNFPSLHHLQCEGRKPIKARAEMSQVHRGGA